MEKWRWQVRVRSLHTRTTHWVLGGGSGAHSHTLNRSYVRSKTSMDMDRYKWRVKGKDVTKVRRSRVAFWVRTLRSSCLENVELCQRAGDAFTSPAWPWGRSDRIHLVIFLKCTQVSSSKSWKKGLPKCSLCILCRFDVGPMFDGHGNLSYFVNEVETLQTMSLWLRTVEDTSMWGMVNSFTHVLHTQTISLKGRPMWQL